MSRGWKTMLILAAVTVPLLPLGVVPMVEAQTYEFKIRWTRFRTTPGTWG